MKKALLITLAVFLFIVSASSCVLSKMETMKQYKSLLSLADYLPFFAGIMIFFFITRAFDSLKRGLLVAVGMFVLWFLFIALADHFIPLLFT